MTGSQDGAGSAAEGFALSSAKPRTTVYRPATAWQEPEPSHRRACTRWSARRSARATIVKVGLAWLDVGNTELLAM